MTKQQIKELFIISKTHHIPVICYGLKTHFKAECFEGSKALLELSDSLEEIPTICSCGKKARFNARKVNGIFIFAGDDVAIDGFDNVTYESLCGECYINKVMVLNEK